MRKIFFSSMLLLIGLNGCASNKNLSYAESSINLATRALKSAQLGTEAAQIASSNKDRQLWNKSSEILVQSACDNIDSAEKFLEKVSKDSLSEDDLNKYNMIEQNIKNTKKRIKVDCSQISIEK